MTATTRKGKRTRAAKRAVPAAGREKPTRAAARKPTRGGSAARRADLGAPVEGFFARQPPTLRAVLDALRELVAEAAPEATGSLKWGMPFYAIGAETMCALAAFRSHVNLILPGPPGTFADPGGRLEGEGKTGRHLKLRGLEELPREAVRGWLRVAARNARGERS